MLPLLTACPGESEGEGESGGSESGGSLSCHEASTEEACLGASGEYQTCGWFESSTYVVEDESCASPTVGGLCHIIGSADECAGGDIRRVWRSVEDGVEIADVQSGCQWPPVGFEPCEMSDEPPAQCSCE